MARKPPSKPAKTADGKPAAKPDLADVRAQIDGIDRRIQELIATDVPNMYTVNPYKFHAVRSRVTGMYVYFGNTNKGLRTACVTAEE